MSEVETKKTKGARNIWLDPNPKGECKALGGADHDEWNNHLGTATVAALPINQQNEDEARLATTAVSSGVIDLKPADPIEGIIISHLMADNQASLSMYRRAWACLPDYFEAHTKYLQLADKVPLRTAAKQQ
jgi:hypothetical protein